MYQNTQDHLSQTKGAASLDRVGFPEHRLLARDGGRRAHPEDEQLRVRSEVERASAPLRSNGGYDMPGLTLNVLAR
jgi:hypothetical protein